jgi:hypothetical protein
MRLLLTVVDPRGSALPVDIAVDAPPGTPLGTVRDGLLRAVGRHDGPWYAASACCRTKTRSASRRCSRGPC